MRSRTGSGCDLPGAALFSGLDQPQFEQDAHGLGSIRHVESPEEGLGLGLSIVRRLMELLGHDFRLDPTPGRGTAFTLVLPSGDPVVRRAETAPVALSRLDGLAVLAIDDDPTVRDGMRSQLEAWGCVVTLAGSSEEACRLDGVEPQVVLADYHVGGVAAFWVVRPRPRLGPCRGSRRLRSPALLRATRRSHRGGRG